ncbi:NUMOD4 motif-containing HNH endonuclease [Lactococcus lactis]|uniref:NUMOD4 motif-containing HNH endonuclease n=1 Tax=Lactococcus lactis TaxID=1358 RepID=UPI00071C575E|nr:NUMOD4 motif-containing HNH endonuclease [Lactococcus lactis]KST89925.1 HNH homing endonuclease [Lactococcus lactis subsp. lactis]
MANTTITEIEYRPIKGFEGQYEVSNTGLVKSLKGKNERILKPRRKKIIKKDGSVELGYEELVLSNKGVRTSKLIHRLVAEAFIDNPENKPEVNHIDEDKGNNNLDNLEWCTRKENLEWGTRVERSTKAQSQAILSIDEFGTVEKIYPSMNEAGRDGYTRSSISYVLSGKRKKHQSLEWYKINNNVYSLLTGKY